jgi:hypothetical protein
LWFVKPGGEEWFDEAALDESTGWVPGKGTGRQPNGALREYVKGGAAADAGVKRRGTVWAYGPCGNQQSGAPDIEAQNHPARWPYKLAEDIVRCFCPPDGLAVDPFVGAGTSAAAALEHGRRFIGGDLGSRTADAERGLDGVPWVEVTARVLDERFKQVRLFGAMS